MQHPHFICSASRILTRFEISNHFVCIAWCILTYFEISNFNRMSDAIRHRIWDLLTSIRVRTHSWCDKNRFIKLGRTRSSKMSQRHSCFIWYSNGSIFFVPVSPPVHFDAVENLNFFFLDGRYVNSTFLSGRFWKIIETLIVLEFEFI